MNDDTLRNINAAHIYRKSRKNDRVTCGMANDLEYTQVNKTIS